MWDFWAVLAPSKKLFDSGSHYGSECGCRQRLCVEMGRVVAVYGEFKGVGLIGGSK